MSDLVASVSLSYMAGKDVSETWTVTRDDDTVDLTGMTIRAAIARTKGAVPILSTELGTITVALSNQTTNEGEFTWAWTDTDSDGLRGTYVFGIEAQDVAGLKATVARGFVTFVQSVLELDTA